MTQDRIEAMALIDDLLENGMFSVSQGEAFTKRRDAVYKKLEEEGFIEKSNDVTPTVNYTQEPEVPQKQSSSEPTLQKEPLKDLSDPFDIALNQENLANPSDKYDDLPF
jgi:hypothetical protein